MPAIVEGDTPLGSTSTTEPTTQSDTADLQQQQLDELKKQTEELQKLHTDFNAYFEYLKQKDQQNVTSDNTVNEILVEINNNVSEIIKRNDNNFSLSYDIAFFGIGLVLCLAIAKTLFRELLK